MSKRFVFTEIFINVIMWICIVYALIDNLGKEVDVMNEGSIVAIVVAIIGVIGTIIGLVVTTMKESRKVCEVKEDTVYIKPKIDNINTDSIVIRTKVVENVVPSLNNLVDISKDNCAGINALVNELEYNKRLQNEYSTKINNKDYLINGIDSVFEENAKLNSQIRMLQKQLDFELSKNQHLQKQYDELNNKHKKITKNKEEYIGFDL